MPITINAIDIVLYLFGTMNFSRIDISVRLFSLSKSYFVFTVVTLSATTGVETVSAIPAGNCLDFI